jgi:hypothetical protein
MKKNSKLELVFYTFDIGPSKNLMKIADLALKQCHGIKVVFNTSLNVTHLASQNTDAIITGLSSFFPNEELAIGKFAKDNNIPWYIIADTHGNWGKPAAIGNIDNATVFVASHGEIQGARDFGYKNALYLGGPPEWNDFWNIKPANIDLGMDKITILISGVKFPDINHTLLKETIKAMNKIGRKWQMIYKPHPNEIENNSMESVDEILKDVDILETEERLMDLLPVTDLSILSTGTTTVIQSAYQRTPSIYFENEVANKRMIDQTGTDKWFPTEAGVSLRANSENLTVKIQELLTKKGIENLKKQQISVYPEPIAGEEKSEKRILDHIKSQL